MTAVIIATGASLTRDDCELVRSTGRRVYVVNDAYQWYHGADVLYACDEEWWEIHHSKTGGIEAWTTNKSAAHRFGLHHIPGDHSDHARRYFDASGHGIIYGGNGGFQALNLAYVHGVRDVVLLGFDMGVQPGKARHCFGEHPPSIDKPSPYSSWIKHMNRAAPEIAAAGMRVRNATRWTRLKCFERIRVEDIGA